MLNGGASLIVRADAGNLRHDGRQPVGEVLPEQAIRLVDDLRSEQSRLSTDTPGSADAAA